MSYQTNTLLDTLKGKVGKQLAPSRNWKVQGLVLRGYFLNCLRKLKETTLDVFALLFNLCIMSWSFGSQSSSMGFQDIEMSLSKLFKANFAVKMMGFQRYCSSKAIRQRLAFQPPPQGTAGRSCLLLQAILALLAGEPRIIAQQPRFGLAPPASQPGAASTTGEHSWVLKCCWRTASIRPSSCKGTGCDVLKHT